MRTTARLGPMRVRAHRAERLNRNYLRYYIILYYIILYYIITLIPSLSKFTSIIIILDTLFSTVKNVNAQGIFDLQNSSRQAPKATVQGGKVAAEGTFSGTSCRCYPFNHWLMSDLTCMQCADKSPLQVSQPPSLLPFPPNQH